MLLNISLYRCCSGCWYRSNIFNTTTFEVVSSFFICNDLLQHNLYSYLFFCFCYCFAILFVIKQKIANVFDFAAMISNCAQHRKLQVALISAAKFASSQNAQTHTHPCSRVEFILNLLRYICSRNAVTSCRTCTSCAQQHFLPPFWVGFSKIVALISSTYLRLLT